MIRYLLNALYQVALFLASPFWLWKVPQAPRYRAGLRERLGFVPARHSEGPCVWIHCASVGEASIPRELVARFRDKYPEWEIVFSTFTNTGMERLRKLYPGSTVFYWPLDLSWCVDRVIRRIRPDAVLLVEQELWPNFLLGCREAHVPVGIINGRMRPSSARFVRGVVRICRPVLESLKIVCARSKGDALRYQMAGLPESVVEVTGSLKYDALPTSVDEGQVDDMRELFAVDPEAPVLVAGSTHPGEEEVLCGVWQRLREDHPGLRLILVPRHIERAERLERELESMGYDVARKTVLEKGSDAGGEDTVILVDTIGDLITCYGMATCVFVGRSLLSPGGGQNMMEPAALGRPVTVGPHTGNFEPEMKTLRRNNAVIEVEDRRELEQKMDELLGDGECRESLGQRARQAVMDNKGAADRTLRALDQLV
ncbi:MAG: 3-deoxy-D-manno-octulosonic acid transferase [Planctomycetota bacterium]